MNSNQANSGLGLLMVLFLIFLVLKLTEVIDWSWWWVTAPLWGAFAFGLFLLLLWLIGGLFVSVFDRRNRRNRRNRRSR